MNFFQEMETAAVIVLSYWAFLVALMTFYQIISRWSLRFYYEDEEEEEDDDIELGDDHHCCRICHEDIRAFSNILRLSNCHRIRSRFSQLKRSV
ncbi:unnamed protein product [Thlaspi arvense]|uniref:Uncharacterized protein n=1 Tax=Thlaspi arvense TaxID=13288 RepID=A0AAU9SL70_THLAR|nr:unnamed protein product [Thlaspi arvense]